MKNELRLDNLIGMNLKEFPDNIFRVLEVGQTMRVTDSWKGTVIETAFYDIDNFQGIPLTEWWLLELGFFSHSPGLYRIKIHEDQNRYLETVLSLKDFWDFGIVIEHSYKSEDTELWIKGVSSVHELQNLYYSLTGTEIKPVTT